MIDFISNLNNLWYVLLGVLLTGYVVLDGFDLGTGILHLFTTSDGDRRTLLNAIGPVWDGNEVWFITGAGALFAAFPEAYATVFSGFYLAFTLLLMALIMRAVAMEVRSKLESRVWRSFWDVLFSLGSTLVAFLLGVAITDLALGIPLDAKHEFTGNILSLLPPYALLGGLMSVLLLSVHGGLFLITKTEGALRKRLRRVTSCFAILLPIVIIVFLFFGHRHMEHLNGNLHENSPLTLLLLPAIVLGSISVYFLNRMGKDKPAFIGSTLIIAGFMLLYGVSLYPNLVLSSPSTEHSITITNGAASPATLRTMAIIAGIGMPVVLIYTIAIYRIFKGKVRLDDKTSY